VRYAEDGDLSATLGPVLDPALADAAGELAAIPGLGAGERAAVLAGLADCLSDTVLRLVSRVLVLELNAARVTGRLRSADPAARWREFLSEAGSAAYWESLAGYYPTLPAGLAAVVGNRRSSAAEAARRFAADRDALAGLLGRPPGRLTRFAIGAGDSHAGGRTVDMLDCDGGGLVYKPRPLDVDVALAGFLAAFPGTGAAVPPVFPRDGYGWALRRQHRYCADDTELRTFYRGIGHLLAVMRLLGGTDLHGENLLAVGPTPTLVDCETLFSPHPPRSPSRLGDATDAATALVTGSVLRIGLLPARGLALGWRGVDMSAVGGLPGQQPAGVVPVIVDRGTDTARLGYRPARMRAAENHPTPQPALRRFWTEILAGFQELTAALRERDAAGTLEPLLAPFRDCRTRVVLRDTEAYAELSRMLWHPVSLHDEPAAIERATELLTSEAGNGQGAPDDPAVVAAEIADLLRADVPVFSTTPGRGRLTGPREVAWGPAGDQVAAALAHWRATDLGLEAEIIRASLVSAYLNEGWMPADPLDPPPPRRDDLDRRRRLAAAGLVGRIRDAAVRGRDDTASWVAPALGPTGWQVQAAGTDVYSGAAGIAVLLAGYRDEVRQGRADPVDGLDDLLAGTLRTVRAREDRLAADRARNVAGRPPPPGGWLGLGSQVWAWLVLDRLDAAGDGTDRALDLAGQLPAAVEADETLDLLTGTAGAIVPLLHLAEVSGDPRWQAVAGEFGDRLVTAARRDGGAACWPTSRWPVGLGGFAHGATGIGWALARLALVTGDGAAADTSTAAFRYEETRWDPDAGGWRDAREVPSGDPVAAWCHGAGGIGVAAADLLRRTGAEPHAGVLGRAAAAVQRFGTGWNHTLCHGDLGSWEVLAAATAAGVGPPGVDRTGLDAAVLTGLERHGAVTGLARDAFEPGLLAGIGGIAYQLLRLHPDCRLPSVLTLDLPAVSHGRPA
jgi:type 2 lantibiotic biosynthesis protein LanM